VKSAGEIGRTGAIGRNRIGPRKVCGRLRLPANREPKRLSGFTKDGDGSNRCGKAAASSLHVAKSMTLPRKVEPFPSVSADGENMAAVAGALLQPPPRQARLA